MTNQKVNVYFNEHFNNFKILENISRKDIYDNRHINQDVIEYTSIEKTGFKVGNDDFLEINQYMDYAFLIKLVKTDFKDSNDKTVHIVFGGGNTGTIKASEYAGGERVWLEKTKKHLLHSLKYHTYFIKFICGSPIFCR